MAEETTAQNEEQAAKSEVQLEGGTYEIIKGRLAKHAHKLLDNAERNRSNIGAGKCSLDHMLRMTNACNDHLGMIAIVIVDSDDLLDQCHSVSTDIVQPSDEGTDVRRSCLCGKQRL